jgi:hypothetical protein
MFAIKRSSGLDHRTEERSMLISSPAKFLRTVLLVDAATCVAAGLLMSLGGGILADLTDVPEPLLRYAGLSLFPVAAFIAAVGAREKLPPPAVWIVIAGNALWVAGSVLLLVDGLISPNVLGYIYVGGQAAAVAALAELEYFALRQAAAVAY